MGKTSTTGLLNVANNGRLVGRLEPNARGKFDFRYERTWLDWERATPVSLFLPLDERTYSAERVWPVFDNLLPDNHEDRHKLAERLNLDNGCVFSLLAAIGRECVGALEVLRADDPIEQPAKPQGRALETGEIASRIRALGYAPLGIAGGDSDFRMSLSGFQKKTALLFHDGKWMEPDGATPTTHILKPQMGRIPTTYSVLDYTASVQSEHFSMVLCRELGLDVADTQILDLDDDLLVLGIKRFDRVVDDTGRILRLAQEDMCQAHGIPPDDKYEGSGGIGIRHCLEMLGSSDNASADIKNFLKAQVVLWVIGSIDGHAKNYSIFLHPGNRFMMAPFYDIITDQWQRNVEQINTRGFCLSMKVGNKNRYRIDTILPRHFAQTVAKAGLSLDMLHQGMGEIVTGIGSAIETAVKSVEGLASEELVYATVIAARRRTRAIEKYLNESATADMRAPEPVA